MKFVCISVEKHHQLLKKLKKKKSLQFKVWISPTRPCARNSYECLVMQCTIAQMNIKALLEWVIVVVNFGGDALKVKFKCFIA